MIVMEFSFMGELFSDDVLRLNETESVLNVNIYFILDRAAASRKLGPNNVLVL